MSLSSFLKNSVLLMALAWGSAAGAADLQVSPVRFDISHTDTSKSLWLTNTGSDPIQVQVTVLKWEQDGGEETLTPTTEMVASPAIAQVSPGGRQLVRIVPRIKGGEGELAYRLRVEELPRPKNPDDEGPALRLLLAYSLPVFLGPEGLDEKPLLTARVASGALSLSNSGDRRVMVSDLKSVDQHGSEKFLREGLVGYVLSGETMDFPVNVPAGTHALRATLNQGDEQDWPISN